MRICLVYDCLFPHTVGGAERWYRNLAERLAAEGHEVTYLTLRQWERSEPPEVPGVRVMAVGPRLGLYTRDGRRRIWPPLVFGAGVLGSPRAPRPRLRRGPHGLVPVLLAAGRGGGPAARALRPARGLARGLVARVLARVPRARPAGSATGFSAAARASRSAPSASRASTPPGWRRRGCGASRRCSRASTRARWHGRRRSPPGRAWCSPAATSPRSACPRWWRPCPRCASAPRSSGWTCSGTGPTARWWSGAWPSSASANR